MEDTDGEPLEYENLDPGPIPLIERAKEWGISVRAVPHYSRYAAYYALGQNEICLATKEEIVFFHELAHVAHEKVLGALKPGQDPLQEIVAQLAGECLCRLVGKKRGPVLRQLVSLHRTLRQRDPDEPAPGLHEGDRRHGKGAGPDSCAGQPAGQPQGGAR